MTSIVSKDPKTNSIQDSQRVDFSFDMTTNVRNQTTPDDKPSRDTFESLSRSDNSTKQEKVVCPNPSKVFSFNSGKMTLERSTDHIPGPSAKKVF